MSLARKDARLWLDADVHAAMKILAEAAGIKDRELLEQIVAPEIRRRIHAATVISARAQLAGISRNAAEKVMSPEKGGRR